MIRSMKNEKGFTLIEVLVALAILGLIAVAFLMALSTASKAIIIADERTTAESLARSQMEYVKNQSYITAPVGGEVIYLKIDASDIPDGYTIWSVNRAGGIVYGGNNEGIIGVPWDSQNNEAVGTDAGLQRIKLVIKHDIKVVLTLEDYKVNR